MLFFTPISREKKSVKEKEKEMKEGKTVYKPKHFEMFSLEKSKQCRYCPN
jgi:hypothetical protein